MRLSWAGEEHPVWGPYFPNSRVRTHMTWQRSSVFLLDVRSSLRKKKCSHQDQKVNTDATLSANWFNSLGHFFGPY